MRNAFEDFGQSGGGASGRKLWALVPVKSLDRAKGRLASCLDAVARRALALAMAQDVWAVLHDSRSFAGIVVITADAEVAAAATDAGCHVLHQPNDEGLDAAVAAGARHPAVASNDLVAYVPSDVPLLMPAGAAALAAQASRLLATSTGTDAVIAPCRRKDGTNFLVARAAALPIFRFGRASFSGYRNEAACAVIHDPLLAIDIDEPADLAILRGRCGPGTARHCARWLTDQKPTLGELAGLAANDVSALADSARSLRDAVHDTRITYSKKVFIPLTRLCRDSCHYCTFAKTPKDVDAAYLELDEAVALARDAQRLGCKEALLTLGERPEDRYAAAAQWLADRGYASTVDYVVAVASAIVERTGLLPHVNMGVLDEAEFARLRAVSASMGAMVEILADRLAERGQPHFGSPDKQPAALRQMLDDAGRARVPFTTGLLIGIGETREERIATLLDIAAAHRRHGHIQEVIVQNFMPKPGTKMAGHPGAPLIELQWTIATARLLLPGEISLQAPPNLNDGRLTPLVDAGINDWGGVSPLTPDHVNPEMPWPSLDRLRDETAAAGKQLVERLTIYPTFIADAPNWAAPRMTKAIRRLADARLLAREDAWLSGVSPTIPTIARAAPVRTRATELLDHIERHDGRELGIDDAATLFASDGGDLHRLIAIADRKRVDLVGDAVTHVVNRNINYTNICTYSCGFCAFSKGSRKHPGGEAPYLLDMDEIGRRATEAWDRGATEVCLQGGIHPAFNGETYLDVCRAVKRAQPAMHIHAFSPLEVTHGARTLGLGLVEYLRELKAAGLGSLPGTAAEILHDPVRTIICPDKLMTGEWLDVIEAAHETGLPTTATIMFGHVDSYRDWAIHLDVLRRLQRRTCGLTEFVPLPFVAHEAPMFRKGQTRSGPTYREAVLMHAVSRVFFDSDLRNIQTSWVKMGAQGAAACLQAGANDLGGVLMNESITRAAGATHGQEMNSAQLADIAHIAGRPFARRTTAYQHVEIALDLESAG